MIRAHDIIISQELAISEKQVRTTILLLDEGGTIPFISRYRKELTGSLDEVQITNIRDRVQQLRDLDKRKEAILKSISEQGKLSPTLNDQILTAESMAVLEDIYLPFKPKRRTRASMAREKGLQGLADLLTAQSSDDLQLITSPFIDELKGVSTHLEALSGARDIIAETIAEDSTIRSIARKILLQKGNFVSKVIPGKENDAIKYKDYFEWIESIKNAASHRVLAMRRGEKEELLYLDIEVEEDIIISEIDKKYIQAKNASSEQIRLAILDSYKRLLKPSMETEIRVLTRQKADLDSIKVFASNLRQLLLAAPMGQKRLMAIDPGFRTGCKIVILDAEGNLLESLVIYPHTDAERSISAEKTIRDLISKYSIQAIAIGNGTAGRETEDFIRKLNLKEILVVMVNESGASIYSASEIAREEFPDYDLTVRGAVSIGRR
ncbi:MAG: Tex-like N-terminal domain-containing protein, partial [Sphingobacterium sp.]